MIELENGRWHDIYELPDGQLLGESGRPWYFITDDGEKIPVDGYGIEYIDYVAIIEEGKRYMIGVTGCATNKWAIGTLTDSKFEVEQFTETDSDGISIRSPGPHVALQRFDEIGLIQSLTGAYDIKIHNPDS